MHLIAIPLQRKTTNLLLKIALVGPFPKSKKRETWQNNWNNAKLLILVFANELVYEPLLQNEC